jgi:hypothetical protein
MRDARLRMSGMTKGGEIPATDRRNDGVGEDGCLMHNRESDDEKIPPRPPLPKLGNA